MGKMNADDDYEIPELRKYDDQFKFDTNSIKSFQVDINKFNNNKNAYSSDSLDFDRISSIQNELLNGLKDQLRLNFVNQESKKLRNSYKNRPIIIKNNDDPFVYSKKYN